MTLAVNDTLQLPVQHMATVTHCTDMHAVSVLRTALLDDVGEAVPELLDVAEQIGLDEVHLNSGEK